VYHECNGSGWRLKPRRFLPASAYGRGGIPMPPCRRDSYTAPPAHRDALATASTFSRQTVER